jgi:hypothetical protein
MKLNFAKLIVLTLITAVLLLPFVFSPQYIDILRNDHFDVHAFLQSELYKQITGYLSLIFVLIEMILTARKRGRSWPIKVTIPGSMMLWRTLHIILGVALLASTLVHTVGVQGLNYNAVFL